MVQVLFGRIIYLIVLALAFSAILSDLVAAWMTWPIAVAQVLASLLTVAVLVSITGYVLVPFERVLDGLHALVKGEAWQAPSRIRMEEERLAYAALVALRQRPAAAVRVPVGVSLSAVLDGLSEGVMVLDTHMSCLYANAALSALAGLGATDGTQAAADWQRVLHARTFVPEQLGLVEDEMRARPDIPRTDIIQLERPRQFLKRYSAPLYHAEGGLEGFLVSYQDITREVEQDRLRQDFIANASHELRTPVTSVKVLLENLQDGAKEDPGLRDEFLADASREIDRMHDLVNDLLDLAKLEASRNRLEYACLRVSPFVQDAAASVKAQARARQVSVTVAVTPEDLTLWGDGPRLRQVLVNLVANAVKFTPQGGVVSVVVSGEANGVEITVSDTGIGIPSADLPHIFDRFFRVTRGRSRLQGGSGLGLTIVKQVVDAHQGVIVVESTEGVGTTFRLSLPNAVPGGVPESC
jgi:signal transduction histidine kinase